MFQQQQPPQQIIPNQQRKEHQQQFISAENQAREKLNHYIFEYLMHIGANRSANEFKNEVLGQTSNGNTNFQIDSPPPGFLFNWFSVFWDLYSAHPDKKDKAEPSNDAKSYHKMMFPPNQFPEGIVNGGIGMFCPPGGFPNPNMPNMTSHPPPDGMFPAAFFGGPRMVAQPGSSQSNQASPIPGGPASRYSQQATRSGAPTPVGIGNNFPSTGHPQAQIAMNDQHMRILQQQRQAQAVQQGRLVMNLPPAPATGPHGKQIRPQFGPPFMGSPTATGIGTPPSFAHNGGGGGALMSPNAAAMAGQMPMTSSSGPIMQQQQQQNDGGPMGQEAARFMMAGGNIQSQFMNHHEAPGSTGTSNAGPGSVSAGINNAVGGGNGQIGIGNGQEGGEVVTNNGGNETGGGPNSQLHSLLNGTTDMPMEMKQSPVFNANQQSTGGGGVNGGTPINATGISIGSNAGAAGPGSVHSQCSGTNNQQHQGQTLQSTPISSESMEIGLGTHQSDEISKIKANLLEGFTNQ